MAGLNKTKIDWVNYKENFKLDYTWNPLYGCKRGCFYCCANRIHSKRRAAILLRDKSLPDQYKLPFTEIQVFPNRFDYLSKQNGFATVFAIDMGDICYHAPRDIQRIIEECRNNPQHRILFLTKDYFFYNNYRFPSNCWLGITMETGGCVKRPGFNSFKNLDFPHKFISIEPLLGSFADVDLSFVSWIIVGKRSDLYNEIIPLLYIKSIKHDNIYWKKSIRSYLP